MVGIAVYCPVINIHMHLGQNDFEVLRISM